MANKATTALDVVHPSMLRVGLDADRQKLADARADVAQSVERAFGLLGLTKQEAAFAMGYTDPGVVSRWCSGAERPLFDKLFTLDGFEAAWMEARARKHPEMEVETVIRMRRPA